MFAQVSCPACQHKFTIPEGDMGKRQVCSNCNSPFFAGKSIAEAKAAGKSPSEPLSAYQKTMLGDTGPAIKYNCPRCKAALESPSIEAGTKKPCPSCGQRLQVPAAPLPAAAGLPNPNKTLLASDESRAAAPPIKYNCPICKKPLESPASEAGIKKPCPACGQRLQVPAAPPLVSGLPNPNRTMLATDANSPQPYGSQPGYPMTSAPGTAAVGPARAAGGTVTIGSYTMSTRNFALAAVGVVLLLLIVPAVIRGGKAEDAVAAAAQKKEIDRATAEVEQKKAEAEKMERFFAEQRSQIKDLMAKQMAQEDRMRENHREALRGIVDQKQRAELMEKQAAEERRWEQEKREMEKAQQKILADAKAAADSSRAALEAAQVRQQTIIAAPPPVYYYPPYHPRYYWPW